MQSCITSTESGGTYLSSSSTVCEAFGSQDPFIRARLVPVDDCGLLVGARRQILFLNAAAREQVESNCFIVPDGFLDPDTSKQVVLPPSLSTFRGKRSRVCLFGRNVTTEFPIRPDIEDMLLPWTFFSEEYTENAGECDLTLEPWGSGYIGRSGKGSCELLNDWHSLSSWISREMISSIHNRTNWFATLHAGGVVYDGKLVAFPGVSHSGKSTLVASLCMAGHPYFAEDSLPVSDSSLQAAAVPLAIKLRHPTWSILRNWLSGFDDLLEGEQAGIPVRFWQPPVPDKRSAPIERIVFPHFDRNAQPEWKRISLIETVFEIVSSDSGPVESTPEEWSKLVASLAKIPAFDLSYSSIEESHYLLEEIARECR